MADKAIDKAQDAGAQGTKTALGAVRAASDSAADAYDSIVTYAQEHPVQSLAIAAGAGALLFVLVRALLPTRD